MGKEVTIVVYKPDTQKTEEYMIVVNPEEYKKYKDGGECLYISPNSFLAHQSSCEQTRKIALNHLKLAWLILNDTRSVAPALIVDSFTVFHSSTGHTGQWGRASKQQLEGIFGTEKEDVAVQKILEKGEMKSSASFASQVGLPNLSRGGKDARVTR
ncbi:unnamed protein product [Rhizoctonia solani]|uniref:Ribosome maturation protein SDO1/SBDS N-terminal domain-containing protein n=1 Tax=Rhizoctonia solani TaxID=456999 RepID=A0A8H2ZXJ7_9AGAM|nr:unnamed protein product [Rhizoctonia solani]